MCVAKKPATFEKNNLNINFIIIGCESTMIIKKIKRNELDIIITDMKPVEVSRIFTLKYFYDFLITNNKELTKLTNKLWETKYSKEKIFDKWHAAPLKFKVDKGNNELRTISLLHPVSMIEIFFFVKLYNDEILDCLKRNNQFSLRYHTRNNSLYYKESTKGIVKYEDDISTKKKMMALEASGVFYDLVPYISLQEFFQSDYWFELNNKYYYFAKIDYKDCFDSMYSHTFKWIVSNNTIESKHFSYSNSMYTVIDRVLQSINSSISNGVLVGPEVSRMMAEILLQQIDCEVHDQLTRNKLEKGIHYDICRYVDDIYIFCKDADILNDVIKIFKEQSSNYQLKINELKTIKGTLPHSWNKWKTDARRYYQLFQQRFVHDRENAYLFKAQNFAKPKILATMKEEFLNVITENIHMKDKVVSYVMGALYNLFKPKESQKLFSEKVTNHSIERTLDMLYYIFSFAPTFRNSHRLISFIYFIDKEIGSEKIHEILQNLTKRYEYVLVKSNLEDIIDYIYLLSAYKIELSTSLEQLLWERIIKNDNPILVAVYMMYSQYNARYANQVQSMIENIILKKISQIADVDLLLYKEMWWIYIFFNCPFLSTQVHDQMIEKIGHLRTSTDNSKNRSINLLYDFLMDNKERNKFIDWNIEGREFVADITYQTYERTIFKNSSDTGIYDF